MKKTILYILLLTTSYCLGETTKVTRIIDGDTFEIATGEKVRLIGINTPEISDFFGQEAKQYLSMLILNKKVELKLDNMSKDRDRYQRLLRYVIIDGVDINKKMVSDGLAFAYLKYNFSKSNDYEQAQIKARETNKGIWGDGNKDITINKQKRKEIIFWQDFSPKAYFIGFLVIFLLFVGLYTYFRK